MSRSRKKHPLVTTSTNKYMKKLANKRARRNDEINDGNNYKKHFCSWNICEYKFWVDLKDEFWGNPKNFRK